MEDLTEKLRERNKEISELKNQIATLQKVLLNTITFLNNEKNRELEEQYNNYFQDTH